MFTVREFRLKRGCVFSFVGGWLEHLCFLSVSREKSACQLRIFGYFPDKVKVILNFAILMSFSLFFLLINSSDFNFCFWL